MTSIVNICNLALSNIGQVAEVTAIDPPDGSQPAAYCNQFYGVARDAALAMHEWGFATRRVALASLGSPPDGWDYRYAYPSNVIKPLQIYEAGTDPQLKPQGAAYLVESDADAGTVIYTNRENAELRYIAQITDPAKFTPMFVLALSWMLASFLAGPITQDIKLAEYCRKMAGSFSGEAGSQDANAQKAATADAIQRRYPVGRPRRSVVTDD